MAQTSRRCNEFKIDYGPLRNYMRRHRFTQRALASAIGVDKATVCLRLKNIGYFSQKQIFDAAKFLGISTKDIPLYFLCPKA